MKSTKQKREAEALAIYTGNARAHSLILHLLFNAMADSRPGLSGTAFKESIRAAAKKIMEASVSVSDIEDIETLKETALAEIANILGDLRQLH
jgi:hypothetical protein